MADTAVCLLQAAKPGRTSGQGLLQTAGNSLVPPGPAPQGGLQPPWQLGVTTQHRVTNPEASERALVTTPR